MTVAERGSGDGQLLTATRESRAEVPDVELAKREGTINPDLTIGANPADARPLRANERMASPGVKLHGAGFIVCPSMAAGLGLGKVPGLDSHIRPYLNGPDLTQSSRGAMVIDLHGLAEEQVRRQFPAVFQHLLLHVKPARDAKADRGADGAQYERDRWIFRKTRPELRAALTGLPRYIASVETSRHRPFVFLSAPVLPDNKPVCIASADAWHLGVLSSRIHVQWALAAGGWLGFGNDLVYVKGDCFDPSPFPSTTPAQQAAIGALAEELDAHRKARLAEHAYLTLTGLWTPCAPNGCSHPPRRTCWTPGKWPCRATCTTGST